MLQERWREFRGPNLRELLLRLPNEPGPFGVTEEGYADFRGVDIDVSLHQITVEQVDFSGATLRIGQFYGTFRRCRFDGIKCEGTLGTHFEDCVFRNAKLTRSAFYGKFVGCDFTKANLSGVRGTNLEFARCRFEHTKMRSTSFYDSVFTTCAFVDCKMVSGSLGGSKFDACEFRGFEVDDETVLIKTQGLPFNR